MGEHFWRAVPLGVSQRYSDLGFSIRINILTTTHGRELLAPVRFH